MCARRIWSDDQLDYLREIVPGRAFQEVADMFNDRYGTELTRKQITILCHNHNMGNGIDSGFKAGHKLNAGRKLTDEHKRKLSESAKARIETTGRNAGKSVHEIGDIERYHGTCYIKTAEGWERLGRYNWRQKYGAVPEGKIMLYKDGDPYNCDVENIMWAEKGTSLRMSIRGWRDVPPELLETCLKIAEVEQAAYRIKQR